MKTTITKKGQTVVPSSLRKKYGLSEGTQLEWLDTGDLFKVIPIPKNLVKSLRGCAKGEKLTQKLLKDRKKDKSLE
ncbi:MAG: hypothetical protein SCARUB_00453 [Candidatus Scalindua rubra]|uniref:SpoVT-AbrB domain-containing protein n=1 Tax=Candidatus Scalindua rubra TaxID=1872076 RepID=A0A1E3XFN0_9BACT|nr:MAG: hypothetical protein SCARUB_00453 [Candidatus Scalindua rubra]